MALFGRKNDNQEIKKPDLSMIDQMRGPPLTQPPKASAPKDAPATEPDLEIEHMAPLPTIDQLNSMTSTQQATKRVSQPLQLPSKPEQRPVQTVPGASVPKPSPKPKDDVQVSAPLFVKLSKYRQILSDMEYLKSTLGAVQNQLELLNQIEKARTENMLIIHATIQKMNDLLYRMDTQFARPAGFPEEEIQPMDMAEATSIQETISDLRKQIDHLKHDIGVTA